MDISERGSEEEECCANTFNIDRPRNPIIGDNTVVHQNTDNRTYNRITIVHVTPGGPKGMRNYYRCVLYY